MIAVIGRISGGSDPFVWSKSSVVIHVPFAGSTSLFKIGRCNALARAIDGGEAVCAAAAS